MHTYSIHGQKKYLASRLPAYYFLEKCRYVLHLIILTCIFIPATSVYSEVISKQQTDELNVETQAIKKEAIELISRLNHLQEKLLYPAHTEVSIFLSASKNNTENNFVAPQSISIKIDDNNVAYHVYTRDETKALLSGGIQRLYTGNTTMGKHELTVTLHETLKGGSVRKHQITKKFIKNEKITFLEIVVGNLSSKQTIVIKGMD